MATLNPTQITLGSGTVTVPGVPWWGYQNLKFVGGVLGFQNPPSMWDVVLVGPNQTPLPGLAKVRRCTRRMRLHRKEHPASDFEAQTFQGYSVVEFDFDLVMASQAQLSALQAALAYIFPGSGDPLPPQTQTSVATVSSTTNLVNPTSGLSYGTQNTQQLQLSPKLPTKAPLPVKISHPALQVHGVDAVIFEAMDGPIQRSENVPDIFVVHFKTVQFKPYKSVQPKTPKNPNTTLTTPLGADGAAIGSYVPPGAALPPAQLGPTPPSSSGGADPIGQAVSAALLPANSSPGGW